MSKLNRETQLRRGEERLKEWGVSAQAGSLALEPTFAKQYRAVLDKTEVQRQRNDRLISLLNRNLTIVERNRYNLEVFLSLAYLERYFIKTLLELESAEKSLVQASAAGAENKPEIAVNELARAANQVASLLSWEKWMWKDFTRVWEKSRYPKNRSIDGRQFLFVMDDLKDHFAHRRLGLEYMLAPFERIGLKDWHTRLVSLTKSYANEHGVSLAERLEEIPQE